MSTVSLYAASETLLSDMAEVLRLYMGGVTVLPNAPGGDMTIRHTEEIADGVRVVRVTDGERCEKSRERITGDAVVDKRLRRRQAKLGVYGLMKRRFGFAPPWGSLTGIRPTRLLYANLNKGMTMDEAVHELQRVFDVSDEKAAVLREIVQVQQALTLPARDEIDLYIGIPFCVSRCAYCSFLSGEVGKGELLAPYVEALEREIAQTIALLEETGLRPRAFYMGGGTPTALPAPLLRRVAGVSAATAKNIVAWREEEGAFTSRAQLKKVKGLGPKAYEQCDQNGRLESAPVASGVPPHAKRSSTAQE